MATLSSPETLDRFKALQTSLSDRWKSLETDEQGDVDILVVPSFSVDQQELQKIDGFLHYEERLLFSLIRLRNPRTRLIYITSQPLPPIAIDYYLQLLPGIPFSHARDRLLLVPVYDQSLKPLSQKILERPRLMERVRNALRPDRAYMVCYNSTSLERSLSVQLGIPLLAADPELLYWGTKSGSRQIFAECGLPHPDGSALVKTVNDLVKESALLWERQPQLQRMVVKLNEGFSGEGNGILNLAPLYPQLSSQPSIAERMDLLDAHLPSLVFESVTESWAHYGARVPILGAIVEAYIEGSPKYSPSFQGRVTPTGEVEALSTHDQILGGPNGQVYLGCRFPANDLYRLQMQELGLRVGRNLADKGVFERFGVDFVVVPRSDDVAEWDVQAIEINLRKGGTTHPFMTLKLLTNGEYDTQTGLFTGQKGTAKYYVASDNLQKPQYRGLLPNDLMDIIAHHHLHFESGSETGTVFHLIGCLSEFGKVGLTSIGNSPAEADAIYRRAAEVLDAETQAKDLAHPLMPLAWCLGQ
ncbi:peptide ligase PGM1-related protein [Altericista sp. CCNU0014]|uniref:peptide ligase PGM1-related protein n=1 Tax=Altericista sp. CCNU0014 TaxID=3082949 RepID=UPI0038514FB1